MAELRTHANTFIRQVGAKVAQSYGSHPSIRRGKLSNPFLDGVEHEEVDVKRLYED
jgi:hypothetical protein